MSEVPADPIAKGQSIAKAGLKWGNVVAIAIVCALVVGVGVGVWQMRPKEPPTGRPVGTAGKVQAFAIPAKPAGEGFTIWRDGRQIFALPNEIGQNYQRVELSSNDVDIAGNSAPDLVLYAWTGGAHCCFTQILIDGYSGRKLGQLELGNGDPMPFLSARKPGLARAVVLNYDDITAYKFGSYAESPMARIVVIWDGKRMALDQKRMMATRPDSPPSYFTAEPDLGDALPLTVDDIGESEETSATALKPDMEGNARGDRAKTYQTWMDSEEARMRATILITGDKTSFGPMAAFLNERIYKGQVVAGLASVMSAYEATPDLRDEALAYYFEVLAQSRWFGDLDRLNGGQLTKMIASIGKAAAPPPQ